MAKTGASGGQFEITSGDQQATVVEVGGGLRQYRVNRCEILDGYRVEERCTGARGLPLVPWPNRIADGQYVFDGADYQVPLTEPDKHNAIHGLLRWRNWTCRHHRVDRVLMGITLRPMMGYPFTVDVEVEYRLGSDGLTVCTTATNVGEVACPYGIGQHPYLAPGTDRVDPCRLQFDAARWLPTDDQGIPTRIATVDGSHVDFRAGRLIGAQDIDYTFTGLARDSAGLAWVVMTRADSRQVGVWLDEHYRYLEIYTAHTQPAPRWRTGLGVEPMSCPPNAFASGTDIIRLEPGESTAARWGITAA